MKGSLERLSHLRQIRVVGLMWSTLSGEAGEDMLLIASAAQRAVWHLFSLNCSTTAGLECGGKGNLKGL